MKNTINVKTNRANLWYNRNSRHGKTERPYYRNWKQCKYYGIGADIHPASVVAHFYHNTKLTDNR